MAENGGPSETLGYLQAFWVSTTNAIYFKFFFSDGDVLQSKLRQGYYEPDQLVCLNP